jgi:steroid delta-isomerase-like uncharacterized protein
MADPARIARNRRLVQDMYEALNAKDYEAHHRYWHEDMIWHGPPGFSDLHGIEEFKRKCLDPIYGAFPDYHAVNEIEFADEDWVAATGLVTGTHMGPYLGLEPTGKRITMRFSDFWSVKDGLLKDNWVMIDNIDVLRQLGVDLLAMVPRRAPAA